MLTLQDKTAALEVDLKMLKKFDVDEKQNQARIERAKARAQAFRNPNDTPSRTGNWFFWTLLAGCVLAAMVFFISGKIELSEINTQNANAQLQLDEARRENVRLRNTLESMATPQKIEEYAAEIGLVREHHSQVTQIFANIEKVIEVAEAPERDLLAEINNWFRERLEFFGFH
jgi:cell division protein FtsL